MSVPESDPQPHSEEAAELRSYCRGTPPLTARLEGWMSSLLEDAPEQIRNAVAEFGSPLNVVATGPFVRNIESLDRVARRHEIDFRVFFARKANKCLSFVDAALQAGAGIDVASEHECAQALSRGSLGSDMVCTAAIKPEALIKLCIEHQVTIVVDNVDELKLACSIASALQRTFPIAIRISGFEHEGEKLFSRFGFDIEEINDLAAVLATLSADVQLVGVHFHLDGYCPRQRVSAICQCLPLIDRLRDLGSPIEFLDIGGGFPMRYLDSEAEWDTFWATHEEAIRGRRESVTWRNHGLGLQAIDGKIVGRWNLYPYYQKLIREEWLDGILASEMRASVTIADAIRQRKLQLRCEPGRSLLDGGGMTVARVEFCKRHPSGEHLIGLAMNRTQCRTGSDDFLVDPILLRQPNAESTSPCEGYLVGAYCTESDSILMRRFRFPNGIGRGDLIVLPNTAGYLMHFLESRSHQFELARNVVLESGNRFCLDAIDAR
ncbi:Y4yA family PLP-dependent enzyme [Rubinisphaera margarita]|uniref:Y4yA family PLP-dependent enzyme n=1 Tax=Rubinisphaera margarita TaxID=2909586 RepID=UPI001EE80588|nr:Y4yA family PLP-dependent enzyme [Rubinisphaera margarita]MCG6158225.1 Y4yA family PLP-dependent enzyme [Rubinisphaera margarita]